MLGSFQLWTENTVQMNLYYIVKVKLFHCISPVTSKQKKNWLALDILYVYNPYQVISYEKEAHKFN